MGMAQHSPFGSAMGIACRNWSSSSGLTRPSLSTSMKATYATSRRNSSAEDIQHRKWSWQTKAGFVYKVWHHRYRLCQVDGVHTAKCHHATSWAALFKGSSRNCAWKARGRQPGNKQQHVSAPGQGRLKGMISSASMRQSRADQGMISSTSTCQGRADQGMISGASTRQGRADQGMISGASMRQSRADQGMISSTSTCQGRADQGMISGASMRQGRADQGMIKDDQGMTSSVFNGQVDVEV
eukprot:1161325-Pelagomonas_calceolata.AAC.22